ncbi:MAG: SUMF1/EgtB/PvdO family nonheme iron enzyme [Agriterribacter sp.]
MTVQKTSWMAIAIASLLLLSFVKSRKPKIGAKLIEENLAKVTDSLFVGKFEVTNKEFREFVDSLNSSKPGTGDTYKSDSSKWFNHPNAAFIARTYFSHPSYNDYPVVAVSHEGAEAYCAWLTKQYSSYKKRKFQRVLFRLPTELEWMEAAYAKHYNYKYPWGNYLTRKTGESMAMFRIIRDTRITFDTISKEYKVVLTQQEIDNWDDIPAPVNTFWPSELGIFHQSGNVAEMVKEKGIAKGGSFNDPGFDIQITSTKKYNQPSNEIGFRIAMEILP